VFALLMPNPILQNFFFGHETIRSAYSEAGIRFIFWIAEHIQSDKLQISISCVGLIQVFGFQKLDALYALMNLFTTFEEPFNLIRKTAHSKRWKMSDIDLPWSDIDLLAGKKVFYATSSPAMVRKEREKSIPDVTDSENGQDINNLEPSASPLSSSPSPSSSSSTSSSTSSSELSSCSQMSLLSFGSALPQMADYFASSSLPQFLLRKMKRKRDKYKRKRHHHRHHRHHHSNIGKRKKALYSSSTSKHNHKQGNSLSLSEGNILIRPAPVSSF
jgi:hypothetical protein